MTQTETEQFCWDNHVPKARMAAWVTVEIGDVAQRVKVKNIQNMDILRMALMLTDGRHRNPVPMVIHKIGRTKVRVYGLGKSQNP